MQSKETLLAPLVSLFDMPHPVVWNAVFKRTAPLDVEIGFGMGEFLARQASLYPERDFVGIEQLWERIYKTFKKIAETADSQNALDNIKILQADARVVFERLFLPGSIDNIYCLYPCPWPKKAHIKHRIFCQDFFKLLNNRLKDGGRITVVTDFYPYFSWMLEEVQNTGFDVQTQRVAASYDTKFERKWLSGGQQEFFEAQFVKIKNISYGLKEDVALKTYKLKEFDPKAFRFVDFKEDIAVIFKDFLFDAEQRRAMVYLIVSEGHLTQHFWVAITEQKGYWTVAKSEGQNFFPTPGIAKAIELVFEAAQNNRS
ncbi:MAG: hypothetical protein HQL24_04015 [Candidatus Omnitrophica bacterium]|nr:hypothetical protein [Candidatus Omnitrophota bacterium]